MLLPDDPIRFSRLDVSNLAVSVLHVESKVHQELERAPPQGLTEHERRHGMVAPVVSTIDIAFIPPLAQEVLDLAQREEFDAGVHSKALHGSPDDGVG